MTTQEPRDAVEVAREWLTSYDMPDGSLWTVTWDPTDPNCSVLRSLASLIQAEREKARTQALKEAAQLVYGRGYDEFDKHLAQNILDLIPIPPEPKP